MKIAIDRGPLESDHKIRGVGTYTRELISSLKKLNYNIHDIDFAKSDLTKYDIVHYPYFDLFYITLPFKKPTKITVTVHDLIPLIYPKYYPPGFKGNIRLIVQKKRLRNADAIITVSETSKKDIVRLLGVDPEKIYVIRLACGDSFKEINDNQVLKRIRNRYKLPGRFVLYVGDVNYNKNIPTLLEACKIADLPLVICGKNASDIEEKAFGLKTLKGPRDWLRYLLGIPHPQVAHVKHLSEGFANPNVMRLGFVPEEDLVSIYNLATLYCQPSYYEGFGISILEAFACGCPVLVSKTNALIEIAENAALTADPKNPRDFAEKILSLSQNSSLRAKLIKSGKSKLSEYSWKKTAEETAEVYKTIISGRK